MENKFKERFSEALMQNEISQNAFAKLIGMKQQTVNGWTKGKSQPDYDMLLKICEILDVSLDFLMGIENDYGIKTNINEEKQKNIRQNQNKIYLTSVARGGEQIRIELTPEQIDSLDKELQELKKKKKG